MLLFYFQNRQIGPTLFQPRGTQGDEVEDGETPTGCLKESGPHTLSYILFILLQSSHRKECWYKVVGGGGLSLRERERERGGGGGEERRREEGIKHHGGQL